jgi:hypothetical protein
LVLVPLGLGITERDIALAEAEVDLPISVAT